MIVAFTGHRPQKLGGFEQNPIQQRVRDMLYHKLQELKPEGAISGMALGVDIWAAEVCNGLSIPWVAAIPFEGQESRWPKESQERYRYLLEFASNIIYINNQPNYVSPPGYSASKMQIRNQWMVDHCDLLIAVWDGSTGGTANCIDYALQTKCPVLRLNPTDWSWKYGQLL